MICAKISEIFSSVQGEGKYVGRAQVFVRFFGCRLGCQMCDTPQGRKISYRFRTYTPQQLLAEILKFPQARSVSLTGGEPLEQIEFLEAFLPLLKRKKIEIYLETNGTLPDALARIIQLVDIVSMDIKLPSTTGQKAFWKEHERFLRIACRKDVFIKVVIGRKTKLSEITHAAKLASKVNRDIVFILQPQYEQWGEALMRHCLGAQQKTSRFLADARIVGQMHKFLKVR